jgi:hypothetical protein|tara:strand:- start:3663 stop:4109 length:447 start_codon:yes stop_codon:yes gene_type:complete
MNMSKGSEIKRVMNAVAAGTSDQNSSSVDMQNFESVTFIASLGTLSASQVTTMKAQQSSDDGGSDAFADLAATQTDAMADDDDDQCIVLEIVKPRERYVRVVLERATGNAVIDGILAIKTGPRKKPTTHDAATVQTSKTVVSPAEGTA